MSNFPGYTPIGTDTHAFNGTFYGNGHVISNLSISASGTSNVGLFGVTGSAARILDLGIENANVSGNNYVGVIAGKSSGTITNCYVKGNVKVTSLNGYSGVIASYSTNTIQSCYTSGSVTVDGGNGSYIGGLVGYASGVITSTFAEGITVKGRTYVGGLVGNLTAGSLSNSEVRGTANITSSEASTYGNADAFAGGCVGYSKGTLSNLKVSAKGTITAHGNYVGGIVGKLDTNSITNCSSSLNISLSVTDSSGSGENGNTVTQSNTGGIVGGFGSWSSSVSQCAYSGTITTSGTGAFNYLGGWNDRNY